MYQVLIADDEADERSLIRFLLKKLQMDFTILEASNGKEALELTRTNPVDILISDVQMPFYSGIELAELIKEENPDIEILFFSGYDDFRYIKAALSLKAVNYILKPVDPEEFTKYMNEIVGRMDSHRIEFSKSERYIEHQFHDTKPDTLSPCDHSLISDLETQKLLNDIEGAINRKQADSLKTLVDTLLEKYGAMSNLSHVYIRHICTTLLTMILDALPAVTDLEREEAATEIYRFLHFSDIIKLIDHYTDQLVAEYQKEQHASNYVVYQIEQYIQTHYMEDLSLTELADLAYLNPNYLSNIFSSVTGSTLNKYIKQIRMEKAKELLLHTNMKITDISQAVGFHNSSYFCKSFQQFFNTSPDRFRQGGTR